MLTRLTRAAAAFVAVLAAYLAYAAVVAPWVEPAKGPGSGLGFAGREAAGDTHDERRRRILATLLPADAWELNDPRVKVLETEYGMLLLRDYRTRPGGQLEIHPCTLVLEVPSDEARRPPHYLALQAPEGAVLQFDRPIDLRRAEIGRPTGGRLQGEVRIFSPSTRPDQADRLEVTTQNVQMDGRRVWTPHEVNFRFGQSYGSGRGLTIDLLPDRSRRLRSPGSVAVAGVRTLELSHLEKAHFELPPEGVFSDPLNQEQAPTRRDEDDDALETPVEITCQGPFRFDFEEFLASFEDDVDVRRLHSDGPSDQLSCRLLEIYFTPPRVNPFREESEGLHTAWKPELLQADASGVLRRIVAVGQPVVVRAPSVGAFVQGDRLEYDAAARRLRLENRQPVSPGGGVAPARRNAVLQHQGRHFEAPRLQYELGAPRRLGKLWASGPGLFRGPLPETSKSMPELAEGAVLEIAWQGEIRLRPHDGLHVVSATGGVSAQVGDVGGFDASEVHVWLREVPEPLASGGRQPADSLASGGSAGAVGGLTPTARRYRVVPDRLSAQNVANLHSPQLSGAAGKLEVWFEDAPPLPAGAESQGGLAASQAEEQQRSRRKQAFDLQADLVQVRVLRRGEKTSLEDATLRGNVLLRETQTEKPGETPLVVAGDLVEVRGAGGVQGQLVVLGDPQREIRAHAGGRGVTFTGWRLQMDQTANRVWIDGPGRLTLPMERRSLNRFAAPSPRSPQASSTLVVSWRKGLDFNGSRVLIEDQVETRGDGQVIRSDSLQAFLTQPVDLARPNQLQQAEVARLLFGGRPEDTSGVNFENQTVENSVLESLDKAQTRNLDIDVAAGRLFAAGPGWIESVRQGGFDGPTWPSRSETRTSASLGATRPRGLTFTRVDFQEAITGQAFAQDLSQWRITFHESVETLVGPVNRWEDRLNADTPSGLGPRGMLLTSRELSIVQMGVTPQGEGQMELSATGRPHIESQSFTADGDRLSYDGTKGLLVLEGGRDDARFWHRADTGVETDGAAKRIHYWPQENRLHADLNFLDLTGFPQALAPGRTRR